MNDKQYDKWNKIKKETQINKRKLGIKQRDIFWAKIGFNVGDEQYGKGDYFLRPLIIIRQLTHDLFIGVPITSSIKNNDYFHKFSYTNKTRGIIDNSAMILQLRTFSIKRVLSKIGKINQEDFKKIIVKSQSLINPTKR